MTMPPIETDYLVIGAGAIGMAFVDTLLTDSDAQIVMVDRHHRPGATGTRLTPSCACTNRRRSMVSTRVN
jgi:L-2-hydroxyglutarate oxidase LhgO